MGFKVRDILKKALVSAILPSLLPRCLLLFHNGIAKKFLEVQVLGIIRAKFVLVFHTYLLKMLVIVTIDLLSAIRLNTVVRFPCKPFQNFSLFVLNASDSLLVIGTFTPVIALARWLFCLILRLLKLNEGEGSLL